MIVRSVLLCKIASFFMGFRVAGIGIYPFIIVRERGDKVLINHEAIHLAQQKELLVIGFYIIYLWELVTKGYDNISFEKEAYENMRNQDYLVTRKSYAQWRSSGKS